MIRKYKVLFIILFITLLMSLQFVDAKINDKLTLTNRIITIDPGHGGRDSGTSYQKIYEKDLNLEISKVLKKVLEDKGATVYMIREDDSDLSSRWDSAKKRGDLYRRILKIQENKSDLYLSIHINYHYSTNVKGAEVLYHPINDKNLVLAEAIMKEFSNDLGSKRKVVKTNLYLYSNTRVPGVLIECGFISNPDERYLLQKESYQEKLAEAITKGVLNYFLEIERE